MTLVAGADCSTRATKVRGAARQAASALSGELEPPAWPLRESTRDPDPDDVSVSVRARDLYHSVLGSAEPLLDGSVGQPAGGGVAAPATSTTS